MLRPGATGLVEGDALGTIPVVPASGRGGPDRVDAGGKGPDPLLEARDARADRVPLLGLEGFGRPVTDRCWVM